MLVTFEKLFLDVLETLLSSSNEIYSVFFRPASQDATFFIRPKILGHLERHIFCFLTLFYTVGESLRNQKMVCIYL